MRILLLCNPRSGRGRSPTIARDLVRALEGAGHEAKVLTLAEGPGPSPLAGAMNGAKEPADVLVVVGGDGTVHRALPHVLGQSIAVYQAPLGTENLFARQFGMNLSPASLLGALERGRVEAVDVGVCNGEAFAIMTSVGPDASIVHRLDARRGGPIRHWSYVRPIMAELRSPRLPRVRVSVDGRVVVDGRCGLLVVANSRQYAMRLDPARGASMTDGRLDVVFFPCESGVGLARWAAAARMGRHVGRGGLVRASGAAITVEGEGAMPRQADGEAAGDAGRLEIGVRAGALRVLAP